MPGPARAALGGLRGSELRVLLGGLLVAACAWAFLATAGAMGDGPIAADERIVELLRDPRDPSLPAGPAWLPSVARDVTALGSGTILALLVMLVALAAWAMNRRVLAAFVLGACLSGIVLGHALKAAFGRERPPAEYHAVETFTSSFPSGHSLNAAVVFLTLSALIAQALRTRRSAAFALSVGIGLALVVGASRVYLGVHWPTDVLAGWAAGFGWAMLWFVAAALFRARQQRSTSAAPEG